MSQHGVVQTQAQVVLDDVAIDSPNAPVYFNAFSTGDGSISLAANTLYKRGTLLAYNTTTNRYVPYDHTSTNANVPDAVLMSEIQTTAVGDYPGLLAKGVVRRSRLVRGIGSVGSPFDTTTLPNSAVISARNRWLFIVNS